MAAKISIHFKGLVARVATATAICLNSYKSGCGAGMSEEVEAAASGPQDRGPVLVARGQPDTAIAQFI
jgi:V8-like Glu-specific endopeptidase